MERKFFLAIILAFASLCVVQAESTTMAAYQNTIIDTQVIFGNSTYTVIIKTQDVDPIITYAPASYEESVNGGVYRAFMPQTSVIDGLQNPQGFWTKTDQGVEFALPGQLRSKVMHDNIIMIVMYNSTKEA